MKMIKGLIATAVTFGAVTGANAAVTYDIQNGKLMAIRGINGSAAQASDGFFGDPVTYVRNGVTFNILTDVEFVDGTCSNVFGECIEMTSFVAAARRVPRFVQTYMLDGVVVDGQTYNFDSNPALINGCSDTSLCSIYASIDDETSQYFRGTIINNYASQADDFVGLDRDGNLDTRNMANATFARLVTYARAQPVAAVPEPGTWAMMLLGFGMVAGAARYRRRGIEVRYA